jgi:hypothetical protein
VVSTKDKGFICTGITGPAMYVIKTDSLGKVYTNIGINETAPKPEIEINPNPSSGLFYVKTNKINSSFTLTVSNSFGSVIKKENIHSCNDYCLVNMSDYSSGIYTISIQTDNNRIAQKVMLVK